MRDVVQALTEILASGGRGALATVVRASGSTPQRPGARLLLQPDGACVGTVGGGAVEHAITEALRKTQASGETQLLKYELGYDLGMCCGGRMEVFVEPIEAAPRLFLFGAGHVAKPTADLARRVGFEPVVVDDREEVNTEERFPGCRRELRDPVAVLRSAALTERDWVLIMTHDHALDEQLLDLALRERPRYIGLIGSRHKTFRLIQRIAAKRGEVALERVFAPVGLDLGAEGPDEIAVSIVAELLSLRRGRPSNHLRAVGDERLQKTLESGAPRAHSQSDNGQARGDDPGLNGAAPPRHDDRPGARVRHDLELLNYPRGEWLERRKTGSGEHIYDVVIVGAGQGGLAAAFGLMRERIHNLLVIDENPLDRAGPWLNFARMHTLRTPKHLTGPDLGIPSLTPRGWYEAEHGEGCWEKLGLIPKETWAEYLTWYRRTLDIPVRPDTRVERLRWNPPENAWEVPSTTLGREEVLYARRVVLSTGIEGSGQWHVPAMIKDALPRRLYAHTRWDIDFDALRGKRVAVLGCGASAFDNASTALEHGAGEVRMFFRRKKLVDVNSYRWAEFAGFLKHFGDLPDPDKWKFIRQILRMGQLPPADTYRRAAQYDRFHLHPGSAWKSLQARGDTVVIATETETFESDFVIIGTGFVTDLRLRPELEHIEQHIARWADRYLPPESERHEDLARHPYLGPGFEFTERSLGEAPYLRYLYNYTFGCLLSLGFGGSSISGMKYSIPRLVGAISGSLFVEDREAHYESLCRYDQKELSA